VVGVDVPADALPVSEGHDPGEALSHFDSAGRAVTFLVDREKQRVAEVSDLFEIHMKPCEGLPEALQICSKIVSIVEFTEFVSEVEAGSEEHIEARADFSGVEFIDSAAHGFDVLLRNRRSPALSIGDFIRRV
jgi:hypothetical protein